MTAGAVTIAMFGDSLTYGHGIARHESLPAQLQTALTQRGRAVVVLNHGVSGNTTADAMARLEAVLRDKPDIVLVALGANDSFDYWNNNVDQVRRNLDEIVARLKGAGITVWLAGIRVSRRLGWRNLVKVAINSFLELFGRPPAFHAQSIQYAHRFNELHQDVARRHGLPLYPDLVAGVKRQQQVDLLHPDAGGVAVMIDGLLPFVIDNLDAFTARRTD